MYKRCVIVRIIYTSMHMKLIANSARLVIMFMHFCRFSSSGFVWTKAVWISKEASWRDKVSTSQRAFARDFWEERSAALYVSLSPFSSFDQRLFSCDHMKERRRQRGGREMGALYVLLLLRRSEGLQHFLDLSLARYWRSWQCKLGI